MEKLTREEIVEKLLEKHEIKEVKEITKKFEEELEEMGIKLEAECSKKLFDNWYKEYKKEEGIIKLETDIEEEKEIDDKEEKRSLKKGAVIGVIAGLTVLTVVGIFAKTKLSRDNTYDDAYVDTKPKTQTESIEGLEKNAEIVNKDNGLSKDLQKEIQFAFDFFENNNIGFRHGLENLPEAEKVINDNNYKILMFGHYSVIVFDEINGKIKMINEFGDEFLTPEACVEASSRRDSILRENLDYDVLKYTSYNYDDVNNNIDNKEIIGYIDDENDLSIEYYINGTPENYVFECRLENGKLIYELYYDVINNMSVFVTPEGIMTSIHEEALAYCLLRETLNKQRDELAMSYQK